MPKIHPIQNSFSSGELSPLTFGRTDLEGYQQAVAIMTNFKADSRGPAVRRNGTRYIANYNSTHGRIIGINTSTETLYVLVFAASQLYLLNLGGPELDENLLLNSRFTQGGTNWTPAVVGTSSNVGFEPNLATLRTDEDSGNYARISQGLTLPLANQTYNIEVHTYGDKPYRVQIVRTSDSFAFLDEISNEAVFRGSAFINVTGVTVRIWAQQSLEDDAYSLRVGYVNLSSTSAAPLQFLTNYFDSETSDIQHVQTPDGNTIYFLHRNKAPAKLVYTPSTDSWAYTIAVTFTSPPAAWTANNYPQAGTYFQGRLWLGGTPNEPSTFWGSKSGLPEDFTTGVADDDALEFTIDRHGSIRWMIGTKNLLIGTSSAEHIVTAEAGVITSSDIQVQQQSAYGSDLVQGIQVGDQVMYISADGRKIRAMQYEWQADNWLSQDLTFVSEHITTTGARDLAWIQNPDKLIACALDDGDVAMMTYERGHNIYGWYRYTTQGNVNDVSSGEAYGESFGLFLIVRQNGKIHVEYESKVQFQDSFIGETYSTPTTTVTGLDHLNGYTVQVLADGAVHPDKVVSGGSITLDYPATTVVVGTQYISTLKTLPLDKGSQAGTARQMLKHWNKLYVDIYASANPIVNGIRPPSRTPSTPMDEREPNRTQANKMVDLGRTAPAQVIIEQDLPLATEIIAIYGELAQDSL